MWWECSECGAQTESADRPMHCDDCGTAGPVYTRLRAGEDPCTRGTDWRQHWLSVGLDAALGRSEDYLFAAV